MAGAKILPKGFQFWPEKHSQLGAPEIARMYAGGFAGVYDEPEEREQLTAESGGMYGADIASANGWAGSAAGQLVVPFVFTLELFPGCLPGPAQQRGDCVSHDMKNTCLTTLACEIKAGIPDEVTGIVEGKPDVSPEGISQGVLSSEAFYWWRRHGGDGWSCPAAARVACNESGLWLRQNYPELGVDLTRYSGRNAGLYGRSTPPESFAKQGQKNLARKATQLKSFEEIRDFLHNGYGVSSCGSEGFSGERNEDGVSSRRGSWAHAMSIIGADDRQEIKSKYGQPLVLVQNSWAVWNSGPRRILGTLIDIPQGAFWTKWSDVRNRYFVAISGINGWPAKKLPPYQLAWG